MILDQKNDLLARAETIAKDEIREMGRMLESEKARLLAETEAERQRFASFRKGLEVEAAELEAAVSRKKAEIAAICTDDRKNGIVAREASLLAREAQADSRYADAEAMVRAAEAAYRSYAGAEESLRVFAEKFKAEAKRAKDDLADTVEAASSAVATFDAINAPETVGRLESMAFALGSAVSACTSKVAALDASIAENRAMMGKLVEESRAVESRQADLRNAWTEAKRKGIL